VSVIAITLSPAPRRFTRRLGTPTGPSSAWIQVVNYPYRHPAAVRQLYRKRVMWYAGWQKTGNFGLKFNLLNSKVQVV
jgi:hypothetical protein